MRQNPERVLRGAGFSRLTEDERQRVIDAARPLAGAGSSPSEVTKRLARKTGRCGATIRTVLRRFDREHPETAIFPDHFWPLREETKWRMFRLCRQGESVEELAKRFVTPGQDFYDLVSDGNMTLMRAVERFDFARGNKFSTYATWAIIKNFARSIPNEFRRRHRFRTGHDKTLLATEDRRNDENEQEAAQLQRESRVKRILSFNKALGGGVLSAELREQIASAVAEANHCDYCLAVHCAIGQSIGLSQDAIADSRQPSEGSDSR